MSRFITILILAMTLTVSAQPPELIELNTDFWTWRYAQQAASGDDIPRVERPDGWQPDWSPETIDVYRANYEGFRKRLAGISREGWTRSDSVDWLCLSSAIERVHWELDVLRSPHRNPHFYVHQTLGILYELLLIHSPMTDNRIENLITRMASIPTTLEHARVNLSEPVGPFADIALEALHDVDSALYKVRDALKEMVDARHHAPLETATADAATDLVGYAAWLRENRTGMSDAISVGRDGYVWFLHEVALIPYTPEALLEMGRQEWQRSVAFETFEQVRNRDVPEPAIFPDAAAQIAQEKKDEQAIRDFLEANDIMTVPDWLRHYHNKLTPDHIRPLAHMGVVDDLTSETRLDENAISYIPEPSPDLSYFRLSMAKDPRPIIVHEGVPGHYFQMAISWAHENPIRRRWIDSGANEGIAFYVEEMLQQFGLFDDRPHTREIIYNFMRLRALRVEVDIQLAVGNFSIEEAGDFLARTVPMDRETAMHEAGFFAFNPGQAITYQIGKLQIHKFLSDARIHQGERFDLRTFHDYLILNGNVPIALLRWEYLGLDDEVGAFFE